MTNSKSAAEIAIDRIRLFFPLPQEECVAVALTSFLAARAGAPIVDLTPDMTMGEVLDLANEHRWTSIDFEQMLEIAGIKTFDDQLEQMTFREFIRYVAES